MSLKFANRKSTVRELSIRDIVERYIEDDDIVLLNCQPSLHKLSIMSHLIKIRP